MLISLKKSLLMNASLQRKDHLKAFIKIDFCNEINVFV